MQVTSSRGWPSYTNLVMNSSGDVPLTQQDTEIKMVARRAINTVMAKLMFTNWFPTTTERLTWVRASLLEATAHLRDKLNRNAGSGDRYEQIRQRLRNDERYWQALSRLVRVNDDITYLCHNPLQPDARVSTTRRTVKEICRSLVSDQYQVRSGADHVERLLQKSRFIYLVEDEQVCNSILGSPVLSDR